MRIVLVGDPILRVPTELVLQEEVEQFKVLIPEMTKAMIMAGGLGLAANQVGISKRFFVMGYPEEDIPVRIFFNPEIVDMSERHMQGEGCLSIPGVSAQIERASFVKLKFRDENFVEQEEVFAHVIAAAVQHEIDHLDGKLYIDYLPPVRRQLILNQHRKFLSKFRRK